ncbi:MAG: alpha/beta fold hydrolase [Candidatus Eremiobacteraeota bacterium]|nr:alpha/beta fold hydrolase [Candidatus Eremiobacteraeota bacterium]
MDRADPGSLRRQVISESTVEAGPLGPWVDDMVNVTQVLGAGKLYEMGAAEAARLRAESPPLQDVPNVLLDRPYAIVPGWTTRPEKFDALVARLTAGGRNGGRAYYVKEGKIYLDKECTQVSEQADPQARVFVMVFDDVLSPPDRTAPQLDSDLKAVRRATGQEQLDLLGYSMGGLATRVYLDQYPERVGKVMLLGTGNKGSRLGKLGARLIARDIQWAMRMAGLTAAHLPAMEWMGASNRDGRDNPHLAALNDNWDHQVAQTESLEIVGGKDLPTASSGWWPMAGGDGMVEASSLEMPGVPVKLLPGKGYKHHGNLPNDSDVYREMVDFFGWQPD